MENENISQEARILSHLQSGKQITPIDALHHYGCLRLGARIFNLKKKGFPIQSKMITVGGKRFARYFM